MLYEVFFSCSTIFDGKFHVFGGFSKPKQISVIENCSLKRTGTLPFDFKLGSCSTLSEKEESVYLCFGSDSKNTCQEYPRFTG